MAGFAAANAAVNQTQGSFSQFGEARPEAGAPVAPTPQQTQTQAPATTGPKKKFTFSKKDLQGPSHFAPIPEGTYTFTVLDCKTEYTKKDNTPMKKGHHGSQL